MPNEHYTERRELIFGSLDDIEQRRLSAIKICYFTDNKEIEINIRSWKRIELKTEIED